MMMKRMIALVLALLCLPMVSCSKGLELHEIPEETETVQATKEVNKKTEAKKTQEETKEEGLKYLYMAYEKKTT